MAFKLVVKDGDHKYSFDKKGNYTSKTVDRVEKFETFEEALMEFLYIVSDEYGDDRVSLTFKRSKKDAKKSIS